jgi:hypothetical protein
MEDDNANSQSMPMTLPPMDPSDISDAVETTLGIARLNGEKTREARIEHAKAYVPRFAETYPKFFEMCANATTEQDAQTVRTLSGLFLGKLAAITPKDEASFKAVSTDVGQVLHDKYVAPLDLPKKKKQKKT